MLVRVIVYIQLKGKDKIIMEYVFIVVKKGMKIIAVYPDGMAGELTAYRVCAELAESNGGYEVIKKGVLEV